MNKKTLVSIGLVLGIIGTLGYQSLVHHATTPNPISYEDGQIGGNIGLIDGAIKEANKYQDPDLDQSKLQLIELKNQLFKMKNDGVRDSELNELFNSKYTLLKSVIAYTHRASIPSALTCLKSTTTDSKQIMLFKDYLSRRADIEIALAKNIKDDPVMSAKLDKIIENSRVEDTRCGF
jgi:hypothetical protein